MNKKPVSYLQTDPRWASLPYRVPGEDSTIYDSGCGPTSAAMLIETLTGKRFTPADACKWSVDHGFKAIHQGTYYGYFKPQFADHGIDCGQLSGANIYGNSDSPDHNKAAQLLRDGYYIIALMGKGLWTSSGHYVVVWWEDGKVHINDPASTKDARLNGDGALFRAQVKYYWWVDARRYHIGEDDDEMTQDQFNKLMAEYQAGQVKRPDSTPADWEKDGVEWANRNGILMGDGNGDLQLHSELTRAQLCVMLKRYHEKRGAIQ